MVGRQGRVSNPGQVVEGVGDPKAIRSDTAHILILRCSAPMTRWLQWSLWLRWCQSGSLLPSSPTPSPPLDIFLKRWAQMTCYRAVALWHCREGPSSHGRSCLVLTPVSWNSAPPNPLVSKPNSSCWIRCCLSSLSPLRKSQGRREESSSLLSTVASLGD